MPFIMDLELIEQKFRKERKDLQAKIQAIKKVVPKGDKKRKKEAAEEIAGLEAELERRYQAELESCKNGRSELTQDERLTDEPEELMNGLDIADQSDGKQQKLSKAQKRRNKKAQEEKEKAERIAAAEKENVNSARNKERNQFAAIMRRRNLTIKQIPSDGHCLYNAVVHQLALQGTEEDMLTMRQKISDHMRNNEEEFLCFLTKPDTGDMYTPDEYQKYCDDVAHTALWGGHHEMKAITEVYKKAIEVLQAEAPPLTIGDEFTGEQRIVLSYHRHEFGLGEHYNSVVKRDSPQDEET